MYSLIYLFLISPELVLHSFVYHYQRSQKSGRHCKQKWEFNKLNFCCTANNESTVLIMTCSPAPNLAWGQRHHITDSHSVFAMNFPPEAKDKDMQAHQRSKPKWPLWTDSGKISFSNNFFFEFTRKGMGHLRGKASLLWARDANSLNIGNASPFQHGDQKRPQIWQTTWVFYYFLIFHVLTVL